MQTRKILCNLAIFCQCFFVQVHMSESRLEVGGWAHEKAVPSAMYTVKNVRLRAEVVDW